MPADVVYGNLSLTFSQPVECLLTVLLAKRLLAIIAPLDETLPLVNSSMLTTRFPSSSPSSPIIVSKYGWKPDEKRGG